MYQSIIMKVRVGGMQVPITGASKAVHKYHGSILLAIRDRKALRVCNTIGTLTFLQQAEIQWMYICQKCLVGCIFDSKMEFDKHTCIVFLPVVEMATSRVGGER